MNAFFVENHFLHSQSKCDLSEGGNENMNEAMDRSYNLSGEIVVVVANSQPALYYYSNCRPGMGTQVTLINRVNNSS